MPARCLAPAARFGKTRCSGQVLVSSPDLPLSGERWTDAMVTLEESVLGKRARSPPTASAAAS